MGPYPLANALPDPAVTGPGVAFPHFVVGRKGWLFSDTVKGAIASANLYSVVETAKANGVEPHAYLSAIFERLPHAKTVEDFEALLPWRLRA
jgi:hypothetical protein